MYVVADCEVLRYIVPMDFAETTLFGSILEFDELQLLQYLLVNCVQVQV